MQCWNWQGLSKTKQARLLSGIDAYESDHFSHFNHFAARNKRRNLAVTENERIAEIYDFAGSIW